MATISVGVRLSADLHSRLETHAAKAHLSKSEVIIAALAQYLGCSKDVPLSQRVSELEAKVEELQELLKKLKLLEV